MQLSFGARREALQSAKCEKQQWKLPPWHRCWEQVLLLPHLSTLGDLINSYVPRGMLNFWAQKARLLGVTAGRQHQAHGSVETACERLRALSSVAAPRFAPPPFLFMLPLLGTQMI